MPIAVVGIATKHEPTGLVTTVTNNVPTGVVNGDVLIWVLGGSINSTPTTPTGWTATHNTASIAHSMHVYHRVASSEPASYSATVASARWTGLMLAYSGVDTATVEDVASSNTVGTTATTFAAITPVTGGSWVLAVGGGVTSATGVLTATHTSSNLDVIDGTSTSKDASATNPFQTVGHEAWVSGAFTPVMTASVAIARSHGTDIVLRPGPEKGFRPRRGPNYRR